MDTRPSLLRRRAARGLMVSGLIANAAAAVGAGELPKQTVLPLELARSAVEEAVRACAKDGYRVSAAVVDRGGVVKALLRADDAGVHTVDSSRRKAYTAASLGEPTGELAKLVASRAELEELGAMNESILLLGGGFPIRIDGELVGGIGVGGAPGVALDEGCARRGLQRIGAQTYAPKD